MKFFINNNSRNFINKKLDLTNNLSFFYFIDNHTLHFNNKVAFQFLGRLNFSFDCFIMAIHFVLYLTYYFFYLVFGSGLKTRISLPFYKFYR